MKNKENFKGLYRITDIDTMQVVCVGVSGEINTSLLKQVHNRKRVFTKDTKYYLVDYLCISDNQDMYYEKERWTAVYLGKTYHYRKKPAKRFADSLEPLKPLSKKEYQAWKPIVCRGDALSNLNTIRTVLQKLNENGVADVPELGEQYCLTEEFDLKVREQFCQLINEKNLKEEVL